MTDSLRVDVLLLRGDTLQPVVAQLMTMTNQHLDAYDRAWQQRFQQADAVDELADWLGKSAFLW